MPRLSGTVPIPLQRKYLCPTFQQTALHYDLQHNVHEAAHLGDGSGLVTWGHGSGLVIKHDILRNVKRPSPLGRKDDRLLILEHDQNVTACVHVPCGPVQSDHHKFLRGNSGTVSL